ncbi:MAG: ABC transporter substrate-binding protein [Lachnospiraceae bacterium]|nr:ABC transporter substrate-binding protein [Lachnospiraceae bacterium]
MIKRSGKCRPLCAVLAALILLISICCAGCGQKDVPVQEEDLIRVGFSQVGSESDWRMANTASMISALSEENGFELIFDNAKQRQENQLLAIRNFIQQDVDYIVLAPIAESGWDDVLQEAKDAGIPVIIVDRQIAVGDESLYTSWVGSNFLEEGQRAIRWLEGTVQQQGRLNQPLRILHIMGTDGATAQIQRTKALNDAARTHPGWKIVSRLKGEYTEAKAYELVRDFLQTGEEIDVIYSENDNMTFGAIRALEEAGIRCGTDGDVMIISFDAVRDALKLCLEGKISVCVECNPLHGPRVASLIRQLEAGETPAKLTYVDETFFSPGVLSEELISGREY